MPKQATTKTPGTIKRTYMAGNTPFLPTAYISILAGTPGTTPAKGSPTSPAGSSGPDRYKNMKRGPTSPLKIMSQASKRKRHTIKMYLQRCKCHDLIVWLRFSGMFGDWYSWSVGLKTVLGNLIAFGGKHVSIYICVFCLLSSLTLCTFYQGLTSPSVVLRRVLPVLISLFHLYPKNMQNLKIGTVVVLAGSWIRRKDVPRSRVLSNFSRTLSTVPKCQDAPTLSLRSSPGTLLLRKTRSNFFMPLGKSCVLCTQDA
jgi:hypothetical protein